MVIETQTFRGGIWYILYLKRIHIYINYNNMSPLWIRTAVFASPTKHSWRHLDNYNIITLQNENPSKTKTNNNNDIDNDDNNDTDEVLKVAVRADDSV